MPAAPPSARARGATDPDALPDRTGARPPAAVVAAVAVAGVVVTGVVLRFATGSPLWLDEAQSANLADRPLGAIGGALRHDGHPPLYYWILHGWTGVFGAGDVALRALSGVAAIATLPLAWAAGRRVGGRPGAVAALVLTAWSPFVVRYATEVRMYGLVMLVVTAGYLAVRRALEEPSAARLVLVALSAAAACWLHYWGLYLVAATVVVVLVAARSGRGSGARAGDGRVGRPPGRAVALAAAGGALTLVPWAPSLLYQLAHTGSPWSDVTLPSTAVAVTVDDVGGARVDSHLLGLGVVLLLALALFVRPRPDDDRELVFDPRTVPGVRGETAVVALTLAAGIGVGFVAGSGYQSRYAAVVMPLVLVVAAAGVARLPRPRERAVVLTLASLLAVPGLVDNVVTDRTQGGVVVAALARAAGPGDVVVYCPDQLGPAFSRGLPAGPRLIVYPTGEPPDLVDWVDYARRNEIADPGRFAADVLTAAGADDIWYVWAPGYRTLGEDCEALAAELGTVRPGPQVIVTDDGETYFEHAWLTRFLPPG